ncbi:MAG: hypothetical protein ACI37Z_02720 [Candidatus Gastranaerophilaceae bacterium]
MTFNKQKALIISVLGASHAVVDFCCAAILYALVGKVDIVLLLKLVVIYNVLAFGLQSVFGFIADKTKNAVNYAIFGCLFLIGGISICKNPMLTIILIGIGNALFHTGGGIISLEIGNGRAKLPGAFVAPGAIGLFLGSFWGLIPNVENIWLAFFPLICISMMIFLEIPQEKPKIYENKASIPIYAIIFILILISVCIRSFVGLSFDFAAKDDFNLLLIFVFAIAAGKFAGGLFADKFGMSNTAVIGLLISAPLLKFGYIPELAILGMFLFNLTMPITLTALANMMPNHKGLAFGLTTSALLIGFLPVICGFKVSQSMFTAEIVLISAVVTAVSLKLYEKLFNRP